MVEANMIQQPRVYRYVGIFYSLFCIIMALFFLLAPASMIADLEGSPPEEEIVARLVMFIVFFILGLPGIFFILLEVNWKIEIGEDEFTFQNTFRVRKTFKFDEVEEVMIKSTVRYFHHGKKIVYIYVLQPNAFALSEAIEDYKQGKKDLK